MIYKATASFDPGHTASTFLQLKQTETVLAAWLSTIDTLMSNCSYFLQTITHHSGLLHTACKLHHITSLTRAVESEQCPTCALSLTVPCPRETQTEQAEYLRLTQSPTRYSICNICSIYQTQTVIRRLRVEATKIDISAVMCFWLPCSGQQRQNITQIHPSVRIPPVFCCATIIAHHSYTKQLLNYSTDRITTQSRFRVHRSC